MSSSRVPGPPRWPRRGLSPQSTCPVRPRTGVAAHHRPRPRLTAGWPSVTTPRSRVDWWAPAERSGVLRRRRRRPADRAGSRSGRGEFSCAAAAARSSTWSMARVAAELRRPAPRPRGLPLRPSRGPSHRRPATQRAGSAPTTPAWTPLSPQRTLGDMLIQRARHDGRAHRRHPAHRPDRGGRRRAGAAAGGGRCSTLRAER